MPHASSFYSNGHLTRKARRHLARLYLEAERDNTLEVKISRHKSTHQPQPSHDMHSKTDSCKTEEFAQPSSSSQVTLPSSSQANSLTSVPQTGSSDVQSSLSDATFDKLVSEDIKRMQWGDHLRRTSRTDFASPRSKKDLNWGSIIHYEQRQFEAALKKLHQERELAKEHYRQSLLEQMKLHKDQEYQNQLSKKHDAEVRQKQLETYIEENRKIASEYHQKMEQLKNERIEQIREREEKRTQELYNLKEMQKRASQCLKKKLEADRAYAKAKKEENRKIQWELILENNREKTAKRASAEQETQENKRLQKLYADMLDRQETERLKAMEVRHEKQQQHDAGYEAIRKQREEALQKEEKRIAHDQEVIAELQKIRDHNEAMNRQKALDENQAILLRQIQEKIQRKAAAKKVELEYKEKLMEIAKHDRQHAEEIVIKANHQKRRLQDELQQQIKLFEDKCMLQKVQMTEIEQCLNQGILNKIANEEHLE